jgi:hypothetical protein
LPAATYTQQQVAVWRQLLQLQRPSWKLAEYDPAVAAEAAVEQAMKVAVAAAAAAASVAAPDRVVLFSGEDAPPRGSWVVANHRGWCMSVHGRALQGSRMLRKHFGSSCVQAACAADLARLAIQGQEPAVLQCLNFPAAFYLHAAAGCSDGSIHTFAATSS